MKVAFWLYGEKVVGTVLRIVFEKHWRVYVRKQDESVIDFCLTDDGSALCDIKEIEFLEE